MEKKTKAAGLVVLDTNIFVDHLRNFQPAVNFLSSLSKEDKDIIFSAITETELVAGKSCSEPLVRGKVLQMLNKFHKIDVTNQIALSAGDLCRKYEIAIPDSIIAATALTNNAELLTKNIKDYKNIEDLKIRAPY